MSQLFSKRLRIEPLRAEHASVVFEPLQHPAIYRFIPNDPPERAALQRRYDFLAGARSPDGREHWLNWVAFLRDTHTPVCTFQATLPEGERGSFAYVVFPAFWRQGYGREVVARMLGHLSRPTLCPSFSRRSIRETPAPFGLWSPSASCAWASRQMPISSRGQRATSTPMR